MYMQIPNTYLSVFILSVSPALSFLLSSLQETYEAKRKEFLGDLQRKEEEMRQMFVNKVKETEAELKEKEREVGLYRHSACPLINTASSQAIFKSSLCRRSEFMSVACDASDNIIQ